MPARILISGGKDQEIAKNYVIAVKAAGGEPIHQYLPKVDLTYDGLLLAGGVDIHPKFYQQEINGAINIDEDRDIAELQLFKAYLDAGKPIFGICRGCQFINIALGGNLIQHINCHQRHTQGKFHQTTALKESILGEIFGENFITNSFHHQAIDTLGKGLKAVQWSENGEIIEAYQHESFPLFAVQWHPERMVENTSYYESVLQAGGINAIGLFKKFIEICEKYKGK